VCSFLFVNKQYCDGAEMSGHFGTITVVPKCLRSEVSWVRSVLTSKVMRVGDSDSGLKRVSEHSMGNQKLEYCDTELTETHRLRVL